jgi:sterol desaturase/sphingolipid hydroxylase (fatty acid hydroxylase superfamily)
MLTLPSLNDIDPITKWAVPVFVVFLVLEILLLRRRRGSAYPTQDGIQSVSLGVLSTPISAVVRTGAFLVFTWLYQFRLFDLDMSHLLPWVLLFFADDLSYYLHHRMGHTVRLLWAGHVAHHSSQHFNFAVALRQAWGELATKYVWYLWLPLVGFHPLAIMVMSAANLVYQFFVHTEVVGRLGPLEWVFNTPSHHRVHHGSNIRYLDRNHGGILIIWDRLFGTFEPESPEEPVRYGLTHPLPPMGLLSLAFHEYVAIWRDVKRAPTLKAKLGYVFMPPGWSHDGSTQTAEALREQAARSPATGAGG